LPALLPR